MTYITLDTCVWLGLIKVDLHNENSVFEEICYWIENKHLTHITPENIIREWDRNKLDNSKSLKNKSKTYYSALKKPFRGNHSVDSTLVENDIDAIIDNRINRIDKILKNHSEEAKESEEIYLEAANRSIKCIAPNHDADSFRDTINILTIIEHIKAKGYKDCIFSTINYKDFSESRQKKHNLHSDLINDFKNANLNYVYCEEEPIGHNILNELRKKLPDFQDFLRNEKKKEEEKQLASKKTISTSPISNPDVDYLENIKHIDLILGKKNPTEWEEDMLKSLINRHDSYKQYFFNNIGNNGLV